jgi:hypothetical protein
MYKGAIVIQGPSQFVPEIKKAWDGYDLIWSTWKGDENYYDENDVVIFNDMPDNKGTKNIALQQKTTLAGVLKAKEMGYERVLKWRSDMIPTNANSLFELFDNDSNNFLFYHNVREGYYIDYFMEGNVDDIYNMWQFDELNPLYAEKALTDNIIKMNLVGNIRFFGKKITNKNDIYWLKNDLNLSTYNNNEDFIYNYD